MMIQKAQAVLCGSARFPALCGMVVFTQKGCGTVVQVQVQGLPVCPGQPTRLHGFHIHRNGDCCPGCCGADAFPNTGGRLCPDCSPCTDGMPPLLNSGGCACATFFTGAFQPSDIVGRSVVIHLDADDSCRDCTCFDSEKIACGVITAAGCDPFLECQRPVPCHPPLFPKPCCVEPWPPRPCPPEPCPPACWPEPCTPVCRPEPCRPCTPVCRPEPCRPCTPVCRPEPCRPCTPVCRPEPCSPGCCAPVPYRKRRVRCWP